MNIPYETLEQSQQNSINVLKARAEKYREQGHIEWVYNLERRIAKKQKALDDRRKRAAAYAATTEGKMVNLLAERAAQDLEDIFLKGE